MIDIYLVYWRLLGFHEVTDTDRDAISTSAMR